MELLTAEALLLDVVDLQEQDRIVTFLTAERGQRRGVARAARRKYSRFAGQLQPLSKVRITWMEKEGRDLVRISSVEVLRSAHRLHESLEDLLLGSYLAGQMLEVTQENEESEYFFRLLDSTVEALLRGVDRNLAARYYEVWILRLAGVFPPAESCPSCSRSLEVQGGILPAEAEAILCRSCCPSRLGAIAATPELIDFFSRSSDRGLEDLGESSPTEDTLALAEEILGRIRRHFLQRELKSYRVMRETLARLQ